MTNRGVDRHARLGERQYEPGHMASRKITSRGRHTVLPIIGDTLVEVRLSTCHLPALVFQAEDGSEAEITIEDQTTLRRGDLERRLDGSRPGSSFDPKSLAPLLELLGSVVIDAVAYKEGTLQVSFSGELILEVSPSGGCEAWHFHYPRPGRPTGGHCGPSIALHGAFGCLN